MKIFLIRHGESVANVTENKTDRIPDHNVLLTERGRAQSAEAGAWLTQYSAGLNIDPLNSVICRSPYIRARDTADIFNTHLGIADVRESLVLIEQSFGVFDSLPRAEWSKVDPVGYEYYCRQKSSLGKLYAKLPMGESPFDVAVRVYQLIQDIRTSPSYAHKDAVYIFTHGTCLRAFLMRWCDYSPEWYQNEDNPLNCAIRMIDDARDYGYIFPGFER